MTLRYVYGQDADVARFVAALIPHIDRGFPSDAKAIGIVNARNEPIGGIVFYFWNKVSGTTEVAIAAKPGSYAFSRETIFRLHDYVFTTRACQMMITRVRADNRHLLRQLDVLGYSFLPFPRLYGRDVDGVICTYTAEAWASTSSTGRRNSSNKRKPPKMPYPEQIPPMGAPAQGQSGPNMRDPIVAALMNQQFPPPQPQVAPMPPAPPAAPPPMGGPPPGAPPAPGGAPPMGGMPPPGGMPQPSGLVPPPGGMPPSAMPGQIATPQSPFTPPRPY